MAFPPLPPYVRDDSFGPNGHNNVLQRTDSLIALHGVEHDPMTGEHNTPHVARTLGLISWTGAAYSKASGGFNGYLSSISHPATGTARIRLASGFSADDGIIEVQPADDTGGGDGFPWLVSAKWNSDTEIDVHLKKNTAALDLQQVFAATDGDFFVGIRGPALQTTVTNGTAIRRQRGQGLAATASQYWNPSVQRLGDNRYATLQAHTAAGLHDVREVSKAWAYVKWNSAGSTYSIGAHQGVGAGVVRQSQGVIRVYLANCVPPISTPVQGFARPVSATTGVAHIGIRTAMVPKSSCIAASVDVYLYESYVDAGPPVEYRWRRVDGDFFVRVHGA